MTGKVNNEKLFGMLKKFVLLMSVLGVVGGGSFVANYWQDREAVRRAKSDILEHKERLRLLENNQTAIVKTTEAIEKSLNEIKSEQKEIKKETVEIRERVTRLEP